MKHIDLTDVMVVAGLAMVAGGLGAYDWRLALIVCGAVLLLIGLALLFTARWSG